MLLPFLHELLILLHNVVIVENSEAIRMLKHLRLQILQHHVRVLQLLVGGHVLGVRNLPVESHDGPEGVAFWDQTQFARREIVVFTLSVHFGFLHWAQVVFLQVLDWHLHDHGPDRFSVVENARVLFLLLRAVKETPQQRDYYVFEEPFQHAPQHEFVFVTEEAGVFVLRWEFEPADLVDLETVQDGDAGEHFEAVELDELVYFLIEYFLVLALDEPLGQHVRNELTQKISHIPVFTIGFEQFVVHLAALCATCLCLLHHLFLLGCPVI